MITLKKKHYSTKRMKRYNTERVKHERNQKTHARCRPRRTIYPVDILDCFVNTYPLDSDTIYSVDSVIQHSNNRSQQSSHDAMRLCHEAPLSSVNMRSTKIPSVDIRILGIQILFDPSQ